MTNTKKTVYPFLSPVKTFQVPGAEIGEDIEKQNILADSILRVGQIYLNP
jgi:hypothetical protein